MIPHSPGRRPSLARAVSRSSLSSYLHCSYRIAADEKSYLKLLELPISIHISLLIEGDHKKKQQYKPSVRAGISGSLSIMADNNQKYSYHEMSNKVQQADRSLLRSRGNEPTGEVETLRGRTDIGRMGDRVAQQQKERPSELQERAKKKQKRGDPSSEGVARRPKESAVAASGGQTILDFDNLTGYQPTTQQARTAYESILVSVYVFFWPYKTPRWIAFCRHQNSPQLRFSHSIFSYFRQRLGPETFSAIKQVLS